MSKNKKITNAQILNELKPIFLEIIADSGWVVGPNNNGAVLFTTPLLKRYIPNNGSKSWLNHQSFTFSIFYDKKFHLITKILPGNNSTQKLLSSSLSNINCIKKPKNAHAWVNHLLYSINLPLSHFAGKNKNQIKNLRKKDWHKIIAEVNKIESAILMHKKDLKNLPPYPDTHYVLQRTQNSHLRIIKPVPSIYKLPSVA